MANDDLEQGRVSNEEEHFQKLLRRAKRGKEGIDQRPSICMVPSFLRNISENSFTPRVVSIGPIHKENKNLQDLKGMKESYLLDLLSRSSSRTLDDQLKECLEKVNASIEKIRSSYDDGVKEKYKDEELADMMVLDGSFILEFCFKHYNLKAEPTLSNKLQNIHIAVDLILLENQIPFFVLQDIFNCIETNQANKSLTCHLRGILGKYIHHFGDPSDPTNSLENFSTITNADDSKDSTHILDCLHKCYQQSPSQQSPSQQNPSQQTSPLQRIRSIAAHKIVAICPLFRPRDQKKKKKETVHSAVDLDRSGVNFTPHKEGMTMKFKPSTISCFFWPWSKPGLLMPTLVIQDFTEVVFRNFIAYEQSFPNVNYYFTSYASAMDKLIDNQADVGKLIESDVLVNNLGSNKEAANMINNLCKDIALVNFYYREVIEALDEYYNSYWPSSFAHLKRTYFNSPWNSIALLAGITLFVLTVVQTIFTVMSYNP